MQDPHKARRAIGLALYIMAVLIGAGLLLVLFILPPLAAGQAQALGAMCVGAGLAFPAALVYLTVPRLLDRYDPEPWYALVGCLIFGAVAACGFSALINSVVQAGATAAIGPNVGNFMGAVVSAPFVEEFWKGIGILGMFYFLRREFDGIVDGIIYASFTALGFAAVENVIYYGNALSNTSGELAITFFMRGIMAPWGHPLYTSMTGIGFGLARETDSRAVRLIAPIVGYLAAVLLHAMWNGLSVLAGQLGNEGGVFFLLTFLVWLLFVLCFFFIVLFFVRRRGRIIRAHLTDEVAIGTISEGELELVASAFGLMRARRRHGRIGAEFARAVARLALSKWHTTRAMTMGTKTVSMDFVVPLRQRIKELRNELDQGLGRGA